jgi:signal transduction histidine kinase
LRVTSSALQLSTGQQPLWRIGPLRNRSRATQYAAGVLALALAYYATAKLGQALRYTASVSAIWPPVGLGIGALYLWGLRLWPGVLLGELVVNAELLSGANALPAGSLLGQQAGNMAEVVVGAVLLRLLIGRRAKLDTSEQVGGMLVALGLATAISATVGTLSMLAGGVIDTAEVPNFWRTWWLGDTAGGLVILPLVLVWAQDPAGAWRRVRTWEGVLVIAAVAVVAALAVSTHEPVTYLVFPALIWAALRFGPAGATVAIGIAAGVAIGVTANDVGPFSNQPIDHKALSTQLYIAVAALTALLLSAVVSEGERSSLELADAKDHEDERATEERHRIARDLHDSVSQALFSTVLHTRSAQRALDADGGATPETLERALDAIGDLTRGAQSEMRALIAELGRDPMANGLVDALQEHATAVGARDGLAVDVHGPEGPLPIAPHFQAQLFGIAREALANVLKHAGAARAWVTVARAGEQVAVEIRDDGRGFNPATEHPGHFGLESMRSRAAEIGAQLTIASEPAQGTLVRVETSAEGEPSPGAAGRR